MPDWKRIGMGAATGGLTELGGARTAYDYLKKDPAIGPSLSGLGGAGLDKGMGFIGKLADGVTGAFSGPTAVAWQPQDPNATAAFGDPNYAANAAQGNATDADTYAARGVDAQNRTPVDTTQADNARGQQAGAAGWFQDRANQGPGPSVAQAQLQQARSSNMRQALSMAGAQRGLGADAALRGASNARALASAEAGGQAAVLRAQEADAHAQRQMQAQAQAGELFGAMRSGDLATVDAMMKDKQVNDAMTVALSQIGLSYDQLQTQWATMDQDQRVAMQQLLQDAFMRAQETNIASDAQRDAALLQALGYATGHLFEGIGKAIPG